MTPDVARVLHSLSAELVDMAPKIQPAYCSAQLAFMSRPLTAAAESWDGAAFDLIEENRAIRRLFTQTLPLIDDADLKARLQAASVSEDENLRISALQAANEAQRLLMIEAHAVVELIDSDAGRDADTAIWREITASVRRRQRTSDMYR